VILLPLLCPLYFQVKALLKREKSTSSYCPIAVYKHGYYIGYKELRLPIDTVSVLISITAVNAAFLVLSGFTWMRSRRKVEGPGFWFAGFCMFTVGIGLVALRDRIPDSISIVVGNNIILTGLTLKYFGILRFLEHKNRKSEWLIMSILVITVILLSAFFFLIPSIFSRLIIISIYNIIIGLLAAFSLFVYSREELKKHARLTALFYSSFAIIYLLRIFNSLAGFTGESWLTAISTFESALIIVVLALLGGIAVSEMLLLHGKLEAELNALAGHLRHGNSILQEEVLRRVRAEQELIDINRELSSTQQEIMITLSEVVEFRSKETALHVARVGEYSRTLCLAAGIDSDTSQMIGDAAPMHDIGKISVPDEILNKAGGLTDSEMKLMQNHTLTGYKLLNKSERPLIKMGALIALEHHEHWNGGGYPQGKKAKEISLAGRVVGICDVYDALAAVRPYKDPWELPRILEFIRSNKGLMFDPELVDCFFLHMDEFLKISERMKEPEV
jgi:HD-GYP domain-containing protein (c-di-GMP phosphodiesterase class II)